MAKRTWTDNEYSATLKLFFEIIEEKSRFSRENPKIQKAAKELDRSVNSILMRLQNYVYCYRELDNAGAEQYGLGNGLSNGGKECMYVLKEYLDKNRNIDAIPSPIVQPTIDSTIINRIIVKLAVKSKNEDFDSDGRVSNSFKLLLDALHNESFSLEQLKSIKDAVNLITDSSNKKDSIDLKTLAEVVKSVIGEEETQHFLELIEIFK